MFSLVWKGHHRMLTSLFEKLLDCNGFGACTIVAEGQQLKAHKEVLCAFSQFFEILLKGENPKDSIIILGDIKFLDMKALLQYIYKGKVEVSESRLEALKDAAKFLQIKGFVDDLCENEDKHEEENDCVVLNVREIDLSDNFDKRKRKDAAKATNRNGKFRGRFLQEHGVARTGAKQSTVDVLNKYANSVDVVAESVIEIEPVRKDRTLLSTSECVDVPTDPENVEIIVCEETTDDCNNVGKEVTREATAELNASRTITNRESLPGGNFEPNSHQEREACGLESVPSCTNTEKCSGNADLSSTETDPFVTHADYTVSPAETQDVLLPMNETSVDECVAPEEDSLPIRVEDLETVSGRKLLVMAEKLSIEQMTNKLHGSSPDSRETSCSTSCLATPRASGSGKTFNHSRSSPAGRVTSCSSSLTTRASGSGKTFYHSRKRTSETSDTKTGEELQCSKGSYQSRKNTCLVCDKVFLNSRRLKIHRRNTCNIVQKSPSVAAGIMSVDTSQSQQNIHSCPQCQETFSHPIHLKRHMKYHSKERSYKHTEYDSSAVSKQCSQKRQSMQYGFYKCNSCNYVSTKRELFITHCQSHLKSKPYKCTDCDYTTKRRNFLKVHMRVHTREKPYQCSMCDYAATTTGNLKRHMKVHMQDMTFNCRICDYTATDRGNLRLHMQTHRCERSFKCTNCDYTASRTYTLIKHMRTHTGERPFKCANCDYTAARRSNLAKHMHTHTGARPFKCTNCDYASSQISNLTRHVRTHTGERPFKCPYCDYKASQSNTLTNHIRLIHP